MSVGSVTSSSLQRDLISALRQTRAASAQQTDASAFAVASQQGAGASAGTGAATSSGSAGSGSALSSDLMASLLQVQSDFSQINAQGGLTAPTSSTSATDGSASTLGSDESQGTGSSTPVHHHRGHHARPDGAGASDTTQTASAGTAATASDPSTSVATGSSGIEDSLQSLLQQVTKAIAAYATTGPVGLAASALTTTSKA